MIKPIRVLIADDNTRSRNGLRALLGTVRMPVMDGLDATRLIKNKWPGVKIVVLTLYAAYRAEALAAGADAFLVKGCPNEELFVAILRNEK
jgi:DNA-binding NarL/FixJ family response regulator